MTKGIKRRSILIGGKVTSIALENAFWTEIDRRSEKAGISWAEYSRALLERLGPVENRASAIKENLMSTTAAKSHVMKKPSITLEIEVLGNYSRRKFLGTRLLIGRSPANEIILDDRNISRIHAALIYGSNKWWISDLDSKNGVWFGKNRIRFEQLPRGKKVRIGQHELTIIH